MLRNIFFKVAKIHLILTSSIVFSQGNTLDTLLQLAVTNNLMLKSSQQFAQSEKEAINAFSKLPDPMLMGTGLTIPMGTKMATQNFGFGINQAIPWKGMVSTNREMARKKYEVFEAEVDVQENMLFTNIKMNYYSILMSNELIIKEKQNIEKLETLKNLLQIQFENGKASATDLFQLDIKKKNAEIEILTQETQQKINLENLKKYTNSTILPLALLNDTLPSTTEISSILEINDLQTNPELSKIEKEIEMMNTEKDMEALSSKPHVALELDYIRMNRNFMQMTPDNRNMLMLMGSISLPIHRNVYKSRVKKVEIGLDAMKTMSEDKQQEIEQKSNTIKHQIALAYQKLKLYKEQISLMETSINLMMTEYSVSMMPIQKIIQMQVELIQMQKMLIDVKMDLVMSRTEWEMLYPQTK